MFVMFFILLSFMCVCVCVCVVAGDRYDAESSLWFSKTQIRRQVGNKIYMLWS